MTEVEGSLKAFTSAHDEIRTELDHLQLETAVLAIDNQDAVTVLHDRFDFFGTYMEIRDGIEDAGLYPALDHHRENASNVYECDHLTLRPRVNDGY